MMNKPSSPWPQERLDLAERLWSDGYKARFVAEQCGISRNALLGMVHRRGWKQAGAEESEPKPKKKKAARVRPRVVRPKPVRTIPPPRVGKVRLMDLDKDDFRSCRWPVSGVGASILFCGRKAEDSSYCAEHRAKSSGQSYGHGRTVLPRR